MIQSLACFLRELGKAHAGTAQRFGNWADYPPETGGVREYASGDAFGRIHWPLSHKHQQLMSKTFEQPLTADLWIVLDLDRNVHRGQGEHSTVEYAVGLAASVAIQIHDRGRKVGLIANDARGTLIEPHRAVRQDRLILDYLAVARADGPQSLAKAMAWDRIRRLPRRAIAVITPSAEPGWVTTMQAVSDSSLSINSSSSIHIEEPSSTGPRDRERRQRGSRSCSSIPSIRPSGANAVARKVGASVLMPWWCMLLTGSCSAPRRCPRRDSCSTRIGWAR